MNLAEFSVKRSLFVNLLSVFLIIAGGFAMFALNREAFPEVSYDVITINTIYSGANPTEVERLVTTPLEKELKEVDDIEEMSSASREGFSAIVLKMNPNAKDKRKIVDDVKTAVDRATGLPDDSEEPLVTEITSKQIPVLIISLSTSLPEKELYSYAERLEDNLTDLEGVASVKRYGWRDAEFWVECDLNKMKKLHISLAEITRALRDRNVGLPAGKLEGTDTVFSVKTQGEFYTQSEIEEVIIRGNDAGNWVRIQDVAQVIDTFEEENTISRTEGEKGVSLVAIKKESADAIELVNDIKGALKKYQAIVPDEVQVRTFFDMSFYIKRRLNVLKNNGFWGFLLVALTLFLFIHKVPAFFTALGLPIAMLTTFWLMQLFGMTINLISMFGLIIVLGMLVDDGIIISENVYRYVEEGMPPKEAAIKGASEVMTPVLATVLTTVAAFTPLMFMSGLIGRFIRQIPMVVCIALLASIIEAFIILPSHLADFIKAKSSEKIKATKGATWVGRAIAFYSGVIAKALKFRYMVAGLIFVVFVGAIIFAATQMKFILFGAHGIEQFMIRAEAKIGTPLKKTSELMRPIEEMVREMPSEYLDTFRTDVGSMVEEGGHDPNQRFGSHLGQLTVYLTPAQKRDKTAQEIVDEYRPKLAEIKGFKKLYFREFSEGPPVGKPIYARIRGDEYASITAISSEMTDYLKTIDGVEDIADNYDLGNKELHVVVDEQKAVSAYLSVGSIASSVRSAFEGAIATSIKPTKAEEEVNVRVRLKGEQRNARDIFNELVIENSRGNLVPLSSIARIEETQDLRSISHLDGKRAVTVSAGVDTERITSLEANKLLKDKFKDMQKKFPGYSIRYGGEEKEQQESMKSLVGAFLLAFLLIFLILATQFNSLIQPFVVMLTIPLGLIGVIFALYIHGMPFSFLAMLGLIGLTGVEVNDSIVLMDFINKLRKSGHSRRESILQACTLRFRPVMLTTITTVAGVSTVAYGLGGLDPFLRPMALTIAWGLAFATCLTLIVIPCVYAIIDDIVQKLFHHPTA